MRDEYNIDQYIGKVENFPKEGILFYDITTILENPTAWNKMLDILEQKVKELKPDILAGVDSRGFLMASPLADRLNMPFILIRKKGKLPGEVISHSYDLEYGSDTLEVKKNSLKKGQKVVILDDLLATGGTASASETLVEKTGAKVISHMFIIELDGLNTKNQLQNPYSSLILY